MLISDCNISKTPQEISALAVNDEEDDANEDSSRGAEHGSFRKAAYFKEDDKMAAASLCVKVGSFSDPAGIPGLAHFLEHMVFMGSKQFPGENTFNSFIEVERIELVVKLEC